MVCPHMFGCPLYIHNTKKGCFVRLRGCPYAPIHLGDPICLDAPYVQMPLMFGWILYIWTPPYVCIPACMFGVPPLDALYAWTPQYVWMLPICLYDVWMPPVHT